MTEEPSVILTQEDFDQAINGLVALAASRCPVSSPDVLRETILSFIHQHCDRPPVPHVLGYVATVGYVAYRIEAIDYENRTFKLGVL